MAVEDAFQSLIDWCKQPQPAEGFSRVASARLVYTPADPGLGPPGKWDGSLYWYEPAGVFGSGLNRFFTGYLWPQPDDPWLAAKHPINVTMGVVVPHGRDAEYRTIVGLRSPWIPWLGIDGRTGGFTGTTLEVAHVEYEISAVNDLGDGILAFPLGMGPVGNLLTLVLSKGVEPISPPPPHDGTWNIGNDLYSPWGFAEQSTQAGFIAAAREVPPIRPRMSVRLGRFEISNVEEPSPPQQINDLMADMLEVLERVAKEAEEDRRSTEHRDELRDTLRRWLAAERSEGSTRWPP
jgi:hypothetical protein